MNSVGKAAMDMVYEVRRQFKEIPGIMEGTGKPEYAKCVDISTKAALREMMLPGIMTIGFPIAIVFLGKLVYGDNNQLIAEMLGGYMAGVTVSGVLWAVFQNNAGGAWDNAKKSFEAGVMINGEMTYKGSDAHKAAVTGDTVGDPFKDTSGPSMNILIKLTCLIGLVIAPILGDGSHNAMAKEVKMEMKMECSTDGMMGKCDMSKCATMTKDECAKMCDSLKCTPEQKEMCLSHYDKDGKFVEPKGMSCCAKKGELKKEVKVQIMNKDGKATATVTTAENGNETTQVFEGSLEEVKAKVEALK
jgi:K(+)-stimulated pyrophosphate-energized sodium pump